MLLTGYVSHTNTSGSICGNCLKNNLSKFYEILQMSTNVKPTHHHVIKYRKTALIKLACTHVNARSDTIICLDNAKVHVHVGLTEIVRFRVSCSL